jgi:transcriptional regulator with XRE-family HTH domain
LLNLSNYVIFKKIKIRENKKDESFKQIKNIEKKRGWSQTQLAEQIGSHLSHINRIETGKYNPSLDVVQKLASVFDVTIDYLISKTDEDFKEVRIEDKELMERVKLIDSMLTKKKIMNLIVTENPAEHKREVNV